MMNKTVEQLLSHQSIRKFQNTPVTEEQLRMIVACAQKASTSSNMQAYSVIRITDAELRKQLAALAGNQGYVEQAPEFLVWCADLYRLQAAMRLSGGETASIEPTAENFLVSAVDTALASQNAAVAAESMGLGIVYIGGIRNHFREVTEILQLPAGVFPVFGMCIGVPDQEPSPHPRQPIDVVLHENRYTSGHYSSLMAQYNETIRSYMIERTGGQRNANWSEMMNVKFRGPQRMLGETL
ncbi:oxygen-insensitive NADPH nitroreductase [Paenibacillus gansuensis]|uniref:Oxygen-insensitive NADPH nitroreductase n=1 Tax=Paenibacillus gansuensis TaxID=306542 RepID=A0ABW5PE70_9BACL